MDPIVASLAAAAIQEGVTLLSTYLSGDTSVEAQLKAWTQARADYMAAEQAFDDATKPQ